jgi:putative FmdB family regulatory protein
MPTYQYACSDCGHEFELFQSFSDEAISVCPNCQGSVRKVYSNVGVVFKGSGFYKTDSRASSTPSSGGEKTTTTSPSAPKPSTGSSSPKSE